MHNNNIRFVHNKSIGYVCGNYRPDFLIDCITHFIVIENDENQHNHYEKECEIVRMYNIEQSMGLRIHFIRYNPDVFKINNIIQKISKTERMMHLLCRIEYYKNNTTFIDNKLSIEYLYYNK